VGVNKIEQICTKEHGITFQKTIIFIVIAVRTSDSKNLTHSFEVLVILNEKWITIRQSTSGLLTLLKCVVL